MAITINYGTVNKRLNSTYVPTTELNQSATVLLKDACSDHNPVFLLKNTTNQFPYNYLKWGDWYYFIDDVVREHDQLISLHCTMDDLATYKANIIASSQFVMYDTSANTELIDRRLSVKTSKTISVSYANTSFFELGTVLMGVVGEQNTGVFALSPAQAKALLNDVSENWLDNADMLPIPDVGDFSNWDDAIDAFMHNITVGLRQLIATGKVGDCIKSCIYVPVEASKFAGTNVDLWLGSYNTGISAKLLNSVAVASETTSLSIPWQFNDWRNNDPYTKIYVSLPYVGVVEIPPSQVNGISSLGIEIHVTQDGTVHYNISLGSGYTRALRLGANCASNFMIGASNINPMSAVGGGATIAGAGVASLLTGNLAGLAVAGTSAIAGFMSAINSLPVSAGGAGGGAFSDSAVISCFTICHDTNVSPSSVSAIMGTPTGAVKSLTGMSGYVECRNASVACNGSQESINNINNALNSGIYIE